MQTSKLRFCWDACVFLALLKNEKRAADEMAGLAEVLDLFDRGEAVIVTTTLVRSEVFRQRDLFNQFIMRPGVESLMVSDAVSDKAGHIRELVSAARPEVKLARNDAIYIATAILHRADALHTWDPMMLKLNGDALVDHLTIVPPQGIQRTLFPLG